MIELGELETRMELVRALRSKGEKLPCVPKVKRSFSTTPKLKIDINQRFQSLIEKCTSVRQSLEKEILKKTSILKIRQSRMPPKTVKF
jgi:hypothetical protein